MKKMLFTMMISTLFLSGCGTLKGGALGITDNGEVKSHYSPVYIDKAPDSELAYIKSANNLIIVTVDGERKVNFIKVMAGKGIDSIKIKEGYHTIICYLGVDINIGKVFYKKGHEYFIDYSKGDTSYGRQKIHYWVKDLTENKIVYGKEWK